GRGARARTGVGDGAFGVLGGVDRRGVHVGGEAGRPQCPGRVGDLHAAHIGDTDVVRTGALAEVFARRRVEVVLWGAVQRVDHRVVPDRRRDGGTEHLSVAGAVHAQVVHRVSEAAARVAHPDGRGEVGGVAGEPGRGEVVDGTGLARRGTVDPVA